MLLNSKGKVRRGAFKSIVLFPSKFQVKRKEHTLVWQFDSQIISNAKCETDNDKMKDFEKCIINYKMTVENRVTYQIPAFWFICHITYASRTPCNKKKTKTYVISYFETVFKIAKAIERFRKILLANTKNIPFIFIFFLPFTFQ